MGTRLGRQAIVHAMIVKNAVPTANRLLQTNPETMYPSAFSLQWPRPKSLFFVFLKFDGVGDIISSS